MKINVLKKKWMKVTISKEFITEKLFFENQTTERFNNYKYFGSQITSDIFKDVNFDPLVSNQQMLSRDLTKAFGNKEYHS